MNDEPLRCAQEDGRKKPYYVPELRTYGDIREITRNAASMDPIADGPGMFAKTT